ncbi:MAG TPA: hypothetical protein VMR19_00170 [Candidatus Saccharimonadales bacterium]|jgi:hypothetical protein|nr:hypothetical protein [Candidatus Saccharimonadales bacterium]
MILIFAFFTLGYFGGVITALLVFPPKVKEIEMQEQDAAKPVNDLIQSEDPQLIPASGRDLILGIRN